MAKGATPPPRHVVVKGTHYLVAALELGPRDSGLHFRGAGAPGAPATLTGAKPLTDLVWAPFTPKPTPPTPPTPASFLPNENNVFGAAKAGRDSLGIAFLGKPADADACQLACNTTAGCLSWTWHPNTPGMNGPVQQQHSTRECVSDSVLDFVCFAARTDGPRGAYQCVRRSKQRRRGRH